ncbi:rho guanine nucleotide exchange factor 26 [Diorhabda sublineata]|uniref:rho guanine nucleotide exchange factor 26 n=1 Tax=Diorhabda sublineata TaxID=1163346 RepID=UPI0024E0BDA0|nr:rho guanine nucleotide exchange factor 26 [Diorhabda sublineata]
MDLGAHSRNNSVSSIVSKNSTRYWKNRRRNVGDLVTIASNSKVYLNCVNDNTDINSTVVNDCVSYDCCDTDYSEVSNSIRKAKDLPKFKNRIFEDSIESQEISFYVDVNSDDEDTDDIPEYEIVEYDSFDTESESDYHNITDFQQEESLHDVTNNPLPPEPVNIDTNGFDKFTKNLSRFKKNFSRDITKSLRRFSKKIHQTDIDDSKKKEVDRLSTIIPSESISGASKNYWNESSKIDDTKPGSLLSRIRRSVSLSASVTNLTSYFEALNNTENQRRSVFYLPDPVGNENEKTEDKSNSSPPISSISSSKTKLVRPKLPPPPVPPKDAVIEKILKEKEAKKNIDKSPISKNNTHNNETSRTSWYTEIGLYSKSTNVMEERERSITKVDTVQTETMAQTTKFSSVIEELNVKLNKNNTNEPSSVMQNNFETESNYNNQSMYSYNSNDSKKDDSSVTYSSHDVQFFEDEPLYQFYDAAVFESACDGDTSSEPDSDIYEDIMDETNENYISSSTLTENLEESINLGNKTITFTRSLWCEIPEVMKSSVLSTLSTQQKKLQEAKFEIITSEASYLHSLNVLVDHFEKNFRKSNIVNEDEFDILFGNIKSVRACSKKILHDFEKCWQNNVLLDGLCDLVQKHAEENFHVYIPYCENQIVINEMLNKLRERPDFLAFLSQLESSPSCQFLSLYSFLMLPMQRITRWPLLVDAILKRLSESDPEYLTCQYALATLNKTVTQCNEAARKKEQEIDLKKISESLEFDQHVPSIEINVKGRHIIRTGSMICYKQKNEDTRMTFGRRFSKITLYLFLFSDLFVVSKKKSDSLYTVLHYCHRNLIELRSVDLFPVLKKKDIQNKNLLYLSILENQDKKVVNLLLSALTETDKERWIEAFSPPKSENPDETLYECWDCPQVTAMHNYNACQPDELSLSRGDVMNVLRKMTDGWYQGERLRDGQTGWFPANYTVEIINPHVRARNLKQRYKLLAFSENYLKT